MTCTEAKHKYINLHQKTRAAIEKECSAEELMPTEQSSGKYFFGLIPQTLFHRTANPAQTALLPKTSPQIPV